MATHRTFSPLALPSSHFDKSYDQRIRPTRTKARTERQSPIETVYDGWNENGSKKECTINRLWNSDLRIWRWHLTTTDNLISVFCKGKTQDKCSRKCESHVRSSIFVEWVKAKRDYCIRRYQKYIATVKMYGLKLDGKVILELCTSSRPHTPADRGSLFVRPP